MKIIDLTFVELFKIITKPRSYLGFIAITAIVFLILLALYSGGTEYIDFILGTFRDSFEIEGKILSGNLVAFIVLQMLVVQMPLLVAFVTGDIISGEMADGTFRMLASKPINRSTIFFSKYFASSIYTFLLVIWLGLLSLGGGFLLFGSGDMIVLKTEGIVILREGDIWYRFTGAFFIAFFSLMLVSSLAFCVSAFSINSITPIVICMALIIISTTIGALEVELFDYIRPFLFTTHMIVWRNVFDDIIPTQTILVSLTVVLAYIIMFVSIAWIHFKRKDITI